MAPKGQKRNAAETKKAAAQKKTRTNAQEDIETEDPVMKAIADAIELSDLPQNVRSMLVTGIRGCLNTPAEQMHGVQALIVGMVDEVINAREVHLQEALDAATAVEESAASAKAQLVKTLSEAQAFLEEKNNIVETKSVATSSAAEKMTAAAAVLSGKSALQHSGDMSMVELQEHKVRVEKGIHTHMKAIVEGVADCTELLETLNRLAFDESLTKALPATCARGPADRGAFDGMVLAQLETSLTEKLAELANKCEAEGPGAKERMDAVEAAQEQLTSVTAIHSIAVGEQTNAEAARAKASAAVETATIAQTAHEPTERKARLTREQTSVDLDKFRKHTKSPFVVFVRDRKEGLANELASSESKLVSQEPETTSLVTVGGA